LCYLRRITYGGYNDVFTGAVSRGLFMESEKAKVRHKTRYEVKMGRLIKPDACACGNPRVEAHHEDYSKPLEVTWECSKCHKNNHHKKTHCPVGHAYDAENTRTFLGADGYPRRKCRKCDRGHARKNAKEYRKRTKEVITRLTEALKEIVSNGHYTWCTHSTGEQGCSCGIAAGERALEEDRQ
jgi:hypothetical protein